VTAHKRDRTCDCSVAIGRLARRRWQAALAEREATLPDRVRAVFGCPLFAFAQDGWWPMAGTEPEVP
jgi:hypothetical protein